MLTPEDIQKLKDQNPKGIVHLVAGDGSWECVFRKPDRSREFKPYRARLHDETQRADATEILARQVVVFPDAAGFEQLLDNFPAIPETLANSAAWQAFVGATANASGK